MNVTSRSSPSGHTAVTGTPGSFNVASRIDVGLLEPSTVNVRPVPSFTRIVRLLPVKAGFAALVNAVMRLLHSTSPVRRKTMLPTPGFSVLTCIEMCNLPSGVGSP